jgi:hypothetical protein
MIRDDNDYLTKAMHSYENRQAIALDEFKEDLFRIITIKKCISKYLAGEDLNVRLLLNNFIILFNVFGPTAFNLIKYKLEPTHYPVAWVFLVLLNRLPEEEMIMLDQQVIEKLRAI